MPFNVGDRVRAIRYVNNGVRQGDEVVVRVAENDQGRFSFHPTERMRASNYTGGGYHADAFELVVAESPADERYALIYIDEQGAIRAWNAGVGWVDTYDECLARMNRSRNGLTHHIIPLRAVASRINNVTTEHTTPLDNTAP